MEFSNEAENSIFCEICGAANADAELGLCPNCLGEFRNKNETEEAPIDDSELVT